MKKYKVLLFDLDGTLTDPKEGITKSVQYALAEMGIEEDNLANLECFIGPPLQVSFKEFYSMNEEEISSAISYYRERFKIEGLYENTLYNGIPSLLETLKNQGYQLVVATSKPTVFSEEILKFFQIDHFFDLNIGSHLDGTRSSKAEIIQYILEQFPHFEKADFVMIGDRKHDLIGANTIGIDSIGVTYGYGHMDELKNERPTHIVNSVVELSTLLT
ncbi:HAD family hydrolase [Bacillus sp. AK128]